jgi:hypothetical protein
MPLRGFHFHFTERLQKFSRAYDTGAISDLFGFVPAISIPHFLSVSHPPHYSDFSARLIIRKMLPNSDFPLQPENI